MKAILNFFGKRKELEIYSVKKGKFKDMLEIRIFPNNTIILHKTNIIIFDTYDKSDDLSWEDMY